MKKEKIELKERNNKDTIKTVPLPKLIKIELFSDFDVNNDNDRRILKLVYDCMTIKTYKKGDCIIKEGEHGDEFFIL